MLFRKIIGTNDTCERNLIYINNKIFSIDDPMLLKETDFIWKKPLNKKLVNNYKEKLKKIFEKLKIFIKDSESIIKENKKIGEKEKNFIIKQLNIYNNFDNWKF